MKPRQEKNNKSLPPILVYQMGKVGSTAILKSLQRLNLYNRVYHAHFLSKSGIKSVEDYYRSLPYIEVPNHIYESKQICIEIENSTREQKWKVITLVRDPIARDISDLFQNIERDFPQIRTLDSKNALIEIKTYLYNMIIKFDESTDYACSWFDKEIKEVFGFDVYSHDFSKTNGYQIFQTEKADILVIKLEKLSEIHKEAFRQFLDIHDFTIVKENIGSDKWYNEYYKEVVNSLRIPGQIVDKIYDSRYSKHFYTEGELSSFKEKWSGKSFYNKKDKKILIVHPEGNLHNNPNLSGIVEILCENGCSADVFSLKHETIAQKALCYGSQMFLFDGTRDSTAGVCLLASKVFFSPQELALHVRSVYKDYDLVVGVDRGIIEASIIASALEVPCGLISYEIFFADEAGVQFKQTEIHACQNISFAICQDEIRSAQLSKENRIPLEKIINIPVAGRAVKRGERCWYFHDKFGIDHRKKIALLAGSIDKWTMAEELIESVSRWDPEWVLVLHNRYGLDGGVHTIYERYKNKPNIYFSFDPVKLVQDMHILLHSCDLGIALYRATKQGIFTGNNLTYLGMASGKIATYLQHGLPLLINEIGEMSRYVESYGLGISLKSGDGINPGALCEAPFAYKERCYGFFENKLDLNKTIHPFLDKMNSLLRKWQSDSSYGKAGQVSSADVLSISTEKSLEFLNLLVKQELQDGNIQKAKELLSKILNQLPDNIKALNNLAVIEILEKNWDAATEALRKVLYLDPSNKVALENTKQLERHLVLYKAVLEAEKLVGQKQYAEAYKILEKVLEIDKNSVDALNAIAKIRIARNDFEVAGKVLTKVLQLHPANKTAIESLEYIKKQVNVKDHAPLPAGATALGTTAVTTEACSGISGRTEADFQHLLEMLNLQAKQALQEGNAKKAKELLAKVLNQSPNNVKALNNFAVTEILEKNWESAREVLQKILELDPSNNVALENVKYLENQVSLHKLFLEAEKLIEQKEYSNAREILKNILEIDDRHIDALNDLAVIEISENNLFNAREILNKVLRNDSNNQIAKENLEYLEQLIHVSEEKSSDIKVSAIVSTYNSERFIRGCLEDLTNQTSYKKGALEIIVIDSCSPQNEQAIVDEFQKSYRDIVYIRTEKRETIYAAWNRAIKIAKGEYITNANTDDRHRKDGLEILANELDENPDVVLVYGNQIITETENETFEHHKPVGVFQWPDFNRNYLLKVCSIGPQPMWRKLVHSEFGYFDDIFQVAGDYEFWLRISQKYHFKHIPEYLGLYLRSPQSAEYRNQELTQQETLVIQEKYKKLKDIQEKPIAKLPLVSIIIPTYNRPGTLKIALESIVAQTYKFIETIVVNDAGIDVLNVIDTFRDRLSIKYFVHNINKDRSAARNTAIKHASGKYIAYLDDDDIFYPDHIETLVSFLETNNTYKVAYTDAYRAFQEKEHGKYITKNKEIPYSFDFDYDRILTGNFIPTPCIMHYKSCIDVVGIFDETLGAHEDWDLWIRMSTKFQFAHIRKITCEYSWREDGSSTTFGRKEVMDYTRNVVLQRGIKIYREKQIRGLFNRAEASFQSGAYNEAIDAYKKAIETSPSPKQQLPPEETSRLYDAYYNLALSYINTQKVDDAIAAFRKAVELHNADATIYNNLGVLYFRKRMHDDARHCFEKALAIDVDLWLTM